MIAMSLKRQRTRPEKPSLFQIQKISAGKSQKNIQRLVFSGGARSSLAGTGGVAWLALRAKMGSSGFVKSHQESIFSEIVARLGGFFFGRAERRPDVFRGEMGFRVRREPRFFVRRKQRFSGKIESATNFTGNFLYFRGL